MKVGRWRWRLKVGRRRQEVGWWRWRHHTGQKRFRVISDWFIDTDESPDEQLAPFGYAIVLVAAVGDTNAVDEPLYASFTSFSASIFVGFRRANQRVVDPGAGGDILDRGDVQNRRGYARINVIVSENQPQQSREVDKIGKHHGVGCAFDGEVVVVVVVVVAVVVVVVVVI